MQWPVVSRKNLVGSSFQSLFDNIIFSSDSTILIDLRRPFGNPGIGIGMIFLCSHFLVWLLRNIKFSILTLLKFYFLMGFL